MLTIDDLFDNKISSTYFRRKFESATSLTRLTYPQVDAEKPNYFSEKSFLRANLPTEGIYDNELSFFRTSTEYS